MGNRQRSERFGRRAEFIAMIYLRITGHRILAHRWRGSGGEIDIVAKRGSLLVFCETKFRQRHDEAGIPSPHQRRRICRAAEEFMAGRQSLNAFQWRFDLVQISPPFHGSLNPVHHLKDAWRCDTRTTS